MDMNRCRFCRYYRPDEKYDGLIGWCDKHDRPADRSARCDDLEKGAQRWMSGEEVVTKILIDQITGLKICN